MVYIEWPASKHRPLAIEHVVTYARQPGVAMDVVRGIRAAVSYAAGAVMGPPLRSGPRVALTAPTRRHVVIVAVSTVDGQARARMTARGRLSNSLRARPCFMERGGPAHSRHPPSPA